MPGKSVGFPLALSLLSNKARTITLLLLRENDGTVRLSEVVAVLEDEYAEEEPNAESFVQSLTRHQVIHTLEKYEWISFDEDEEVLHLQQYPNFVDKVLDAAVSDGVISEEEMLIS
jgi:hypothetical protein